MITWRIPRESKEWVGPIVITVNGVPVTAGVKFAVLPNGTRPTSGDWANPVTDPSAPNTALGVQADPVAAAAPFGIWAQITSSPEIPVLEPRDVGQIIRT